MIVMTRARRWATVLVCILAVCALWGGRESRPAQAQGSRRVFLPITQQAGEAACAAIPGAQYASVTIQGLPSDRPAATHPDLNLAIRGYTATIGYLGLVDIGGPTDGRAPQLAGLFAPRRVPAVVSLYRVYDWDWPAMRRGAPLGDPAVTFMRVGTTAGEIVRTPDAEYTIGSGFQALLLYASRDRLTLKYTREDNVVYGYTLHLEGLCVEPTLLALYTTWNQAGRAQLPALRAGQPLGRARGASIGLAIRDSGSFLDPRSRKDWWQR